MRNLLTPSVVLGCLAGLAFLLSMALLLAVVYQCWRDNEEAKAEAAADYQRALESAHRLPRPMSEPAPQGFRRKDPA